MLQGGARPCPSRYQPDEQRVLTTDASTTAGTPPLGREIQRLPCCASKIAIEPCACGASDEDHLQRERRSPRSSAQRGLTDTC